MSQYCSNCYFWAATPAAGGGNCRRYAPRPSNSRLDQTYWPRVSADAWCGEWKPEVVKTDVDVSA